MSGSPAKKVITIGVVIAIIALLVPFSVSCSKPPRPVADFTVSYVSGELLIPEDPIAGTIPLMVRFTDQSSGKISSWRWNFGDGPAIEGGEELRDITHVYTVSNSSGFIVLLTVRGPGGKDDQVKEGLVAVYSCSEAANVELGQAKQAIKDCMGNARTLDKSVKGWDGSRGKVTVGGRDAADYLGVWRTFKATYDVSTGGDIDSGTDVSWGCVKWTLTGMGWRWGAK
jgi:PKD repeat protein